MLKAKVAIAFLFISASHEFFEGGNEPVLRGR
jgi:hypothetical protein